MAFLDDFYNVLANGLATQEHVDFKTTGTVARKFLYIDSPSFSKCELRIWVRKEKPEDFEKGKYPLDDWRIHLKITPHDSRSPIDIVIVQMLIVRPGNPVCLQWFDSSLVQDEFNHNFHLSWPLGGTVTKKQINEMRDIALQIRIEPPRPPGNKSTFTDRQRQYVVDEWENGTEKQSVVARKYGISERTLRRWVRDFQNRT